MNPDVIGKSRPFTDLRRTKPQGEVPTPFGWQVLLGYMQTKEDNHSASGEICTASAMRKASDWAELMITNSIQAS